jgi:centrosomal protein CEP120
LGSAEIPLKDLLVKNSTEIYMKPVSIEGSFQLIPPNKTKQQITLAPGDLSPSVGVSIVLRKEETVGIFCTNFSEFSNYGGESMFYLIDI